MWESEHTNPPLTAVHVPKREMGRVATERLIDLMDDQQAKTLPVKLVLPTHLVVRASS